MSEIGFPLLGTAFVVLFVLPLCALAAKTLLWTLERIEAHGPLHGLSLRYLVLTASSALPLAWLLSAGMHQAETGRSAVACLFDHDAAPCFEPGLFAVTLLLVLLLVSLKELRNARGARLSSTPAALLIQSRVARIISRRPELHDLSHRIGVTDEEGYALGTQGLFWPRVVIESAYAEGSSDEELACALGHEAEHVRARDPLRYLVLSLALAVNPFGRRLLSSHATSWLAAREAHCDREAVIRGAGPLSLADALLRAARPRVRPAAALGARDASLLKLRVHMLLAFDEQLPTRCCHREPTSVPVVLALLLLTALLPHHTGTAALDALHIGTEHALHLFWR